MKKPKRIKVTPLPKLIKQADAVFSRWIRNRDGYKCVICGSTEVVQCGHLIKRGKHATRFNERNCNAQCSRCNLKHNFYPEYYTNWFISHWGVGEYRKLIELASKPYKFTRQELNEIIEGYK
jgi:hypothetical protein